MFNSNVTFVGFAFGCKDKNDDGLTIIPYQPTTYALNYDEKIFPKMIIPADNPLTTEGVELGRFLFYDKLPSGKWQFAHAIVPLAERSLS